MSVLPPNSLTILLWNANGVHTHTNELTVVLQEKDIDIALITETRLTRMKHFNIQGYRTYRTDHPDGRAHGGTAILIRNSLSHHSLPTNPSDFLQATALSVSTSSFSLPIASVYCPPGQAITAAQFKQFFDTLGPRFLSGGDYNAKHLLWGSRTTNPRGRSLYSTISSCNFSTSSPNTPTYWPTDENRLPDLIDIFVHKNLGPLHSTVTTIPELSSDHSPVLLTLSLFPIPKPLPPSLINGPVDWEAFRSFLNSNLNLNVSLKTPEDLDIAVHSFTSTIQEAIWKASPTPFPIKPPKPEPLPNHIKHLMSLKRRARALWQRFRHPSDRHSFNVLSHRVTRALNTHRNHSFSSHLSQLSSKDRSLWMATRKILKHHIPSPPLRRDDGSWAKSDGEKSETFAKHLQNTFKPHPDPDNHSHESIINDFLDSPLPLSLPPRAVTPSEVKFLISRLPKRKTPGYDLITSNILRQLPHKAIVFLTYLYNCIFRTTYFPILWKYSDVILIPKPNKPSQEPSSYRPISLLPILSKIFERILLKRIMPILESLNILPHHQFGFRSRHSTVQQVFRVVDHISSALERKENCMGVFQDVAQAFDRVWHKGLLYKLKRILPSTIYLILKSYLSNRFFRVRQGCDYSDFYPVEAGVPQGSVLGPILYIIFTFDVPTSLHSLLASFADDKAILVSDPDPATASQTLQDHLNKIAQWCRRWRIKVNENKCIHVTFSLRRKSPLRLSFNNIPIPTADSVRYLGFHLDSRLTWSEHTRLKRQDLNKRFGQLYRLLGRKSQLSTENKLTLYKTLLRPIWTYGLELWGTAKPSNLRRIQSFQNKVLRSIVNAPFYISNETLHNDLSVPYIQELASQRFQKFHANLSSHPNPLAHSLSSRTHPDSPPRRLKRRWPRDLLPMEE